MKRFLITLILLGTASAGFSLPYTEQWENGNNFWIYYDGTGDGEPMPTRNQGGVADSGYAYCPLDSAPEWSQSIYVPAQLLDPQSNPPQAAGSLLGQNLTVSVNDLGSAVLYGANLYFFVAEWQEVAQTWILYMLNSPIAIGDDSWAETSLPISSDPNDWITIDGGLSKSVNDILAQPQQYGFALAGGNADPSGELGFDALTINAVPEPSVILLSLFGWILITRIRRRIT